MVLNRTSAWEMLRVICLMEMSHLVEMLCLRKYKASSMHGKKYFHEGIQQVIHETWHGDMRVK